MASVLPNHVAVGTDITADNNGDHRKQSPGGSVT